MRPLGRAQEIGLLAFWRDLVAAATLAPDEPKSGFTLWNAVAFYLAIAETIFSSLLSIAFEFTPFQLTLNDSVLKLRRIVLILGANPMDDSDRQTFHFSIPRKPS